MAEEILEETQTEGTTETTPSEGTTEGTQTEGTTGNGYLTKPYLVRNLQIFWGKIKQYIADKIEDFASKDYVDGVIDNAVDGKAEASALKDLETTVTDKVSQAELTERLAGKVDKIEGKKLSDENFTSVLKTKLENLKDSVVTQSDPGLMSAADKKKLDSIAEGATAVTVDTEWNPNSENPAQSKIISEELAKKADKEADPLDPSDLIRFNNITSYATDEGHIVLNFIRDTEHLKIYTPNSDRPIEKVSLKDQNEILFTNFQKNDDDTLAITIENPEGKTETEDESGTSKITWKITPGESFKFYVKDFILDNSRYEPFILEATRDDMGGTQVVLDIMKISES